MARFLSSVDEIFQITGRGCVVIPGILKSDSEAKVKVGDGIILRKPDGTEVETSVAGIEMGGRVPSNGIPLLLGAEITKDQVPLGTEVWQK